MSDVLLAPRLPQRFLEPGDLLLLREPCEVTTVLGSCVAVTLWHRTTRSAAICHAMLAAPSDESGHPGDPVRRWKYVTDAVPKMVEFFLHRAVRPGTLQAKVFGGSDLLRMESHDAENSIGAGNTRTAVGLLGSYGITVKACDTGGRTGRKLIFNTFTGGVRVKLLPSPLPQPL
ncbi:MAG: chemotaxis protein CheD [Opitutaceae bacterium]|nr:chemotaxis protein CheD [Opitutaceae bacterium]